MIPRSAHRRRRGRSRRRSPWPGGHRRRPHRRSRVRPRRPSRGVPRWGPARSGRNVLARRRTQGSQDVDLGILQPDSIHHRGRRIHGHQAQDLQNAVLYDVLQRPHPVVEGGAALEGQRLFPQDVDLSMCSIRHAMVAAAELWRRPGRRRKASSIHRATVCGSALQPPTSLCYWTPLSHLTPAVRRGTRR
jgi:hypothetical protein